MVVYFDKENYLNYLKESRKTQIGLDTLRMIKNQLVVHLNFELNDLDEYEFILHQEFEEGVSVDFRLSKGIDKITRPLNRDSFPSKRGIYLLNEDVQGIKKLHNVLIGSVHEEIDVLKKLIIGEDYSFHLEKRIGTEILPNQHLDILSFPFSTLVIIDRYLFKGPIPGGNIDLYEYNLDKILKTIFREKRSNSRLIFVFQINIRVAKTDRNYDEGPDIDTLAAKIRKVVHKHCPSPELFFIAVPQGYIDDEHDRWILSNYLRIKSGDSLIYFNSRDEITSDSKTVDFYSLARRDYRKVNKDILDKINDICDETLRAYPRFSKTPNDVANSGIINFS
jgi:mRNA-degrading endonuclease RelE of RelBE toxin-antitoxin system